MFKKLLLTPSKALLSAKPSARISSLREYVSLYESLNTSAAERAESGLNSISQKYDISREDLSSLFQIVNAEPELLKEYVDREAWLRYTEEVKFLWRSSPFYIPGKSFQSAVEELKQRYPEVANFDVNFPERARAFQILESIFLRDGPKVRNIADGNTVQRFHPEWVSRIQGHVNELQNTTKVDTQTTLPGFTSSNVYADIAKALGSAAESLERDPSFAYGRIRHMLAVHKLRRGELKISEERLPKVGTSREEQEIEAAEEINDIDLLIAERNNQLRKSLNYNFLPWINDRKIIFEAKVEQANTLVWGALAGTFGAYLLYKLYQGDATDTTLLATIAVLGFSLSRVRTNTFRNRFGYLVQMNLHKNGQQLDLFIQRGANNVEKIEGVPISEFQLHRGDYQFNFPQTKLNQLLSKHNYVKPGFRLSNARRVGIGHGSWVATYGENYVFVPMDHTGNRIVLDSIFKGKSLELTAA